MACCGFRRWANSNDGGTRVCRDGFGMAMHCEAMDGSPANGAFVQHRRMCTEDEILRRCRAE